MSMKFPLTPAGIEPATFRFVAQHLNHCATTVPIIIIIIVIIKKLHQFSCFQSVFVTDQASPYSSIC